VRAGAQAGNGSRACEDCNRPADFDRGDWSSHIHNVRVEVTAPRGASRWARRECQAVEPTLAVTPVDTELGENRHERGCSGPACDERRAGPLDDSPSISCPHQSDVGEEYQEKGNNELCAVHDFLPSLMVGSFRCCNERSSPKRTEGGQCPPSVWSTYRR